MRIRQIKGLGLGTLNGRTEKPEGLTASDIGPSVKIGLWKLGFKKQLAVIGCLMSTIWCLLKIHVMSSLILVESPSLAISDRTSMHCFCVHLLRVLRDLPENHDKFMPLYLVVHEQLSPWPYKGQQWAVRTSNPDQWLHGETTSEWFRKLSVICVS